MNDDEPLDLGEELRRIAAARVARLRHAKRVRAALKTARDVGLERRHALKLARIRARKEQEES